MRRLGIPTTPHGIRRSFAEWAAEQPEIAASTPDEVLAHHTTHRTREDIKMTNEPTNYHPHLHPGELGAALKLIRDSDACWAEVCCLLFMSYTVTRSGEAGSATWGEIDWETSTWHIPAARTKGGRPHEVPLSSQAIGILTYAKARTNGDGPIFPAKRGGGRLASARLAALMRRLGIPTTPHGIRRSFAEWAAGRPEIAATTAEEVLAHNFTGKAPWPGLDVFSWSDRSDCGLPVGRHGHQPTPAAEAVRR